MARNRSITYAEYGIPGLDTCSNDKEKDTVVRQFKDQLSHALHNHSILTSYDGLQTALENDKWRQTRCQNPQPQLQKVRDVHELHKAALTAFRHDDNARQEFISQDLKLVDLPDFTTYYRDLNHLLHDKAEKKASNAVIESDVKAFLSHFRRQATHQEREHATKRLQHHIRRLGIEDLLFDLWTQDCEDRENEREVGEEARTEARVPQLDSTTLNNDIQDQTHDEVAEEPATTTFNNLAGDQAKAGAEVTRSGSLIEESHVVPSTLPEPATLSNNVRTRAKQTYNSVQTILTEVWKFVNATVTPATPDAQATTTDEQGHQLITLPDMQATDTDTQALNTTTLADITATDIDLEVIDSTITIGASPPVFATQSSPPTTRSHLEIHSAGQGKNLKRGHDSDTADSPHPKRLRLDITLRLVTT